MDCFFFKQKTAYEMRISDWSSDVCSSDLREFRRTVLFLVQRRRRTGNPQIHGLFGAVEKTRTSTAFRPQRPQRCASTSSATTAHKRMPGKPASGRPVPLAKRIGQRNHGKSSDEDFYCIMLRRARCRETLCYRM